MNRVLGRAEEELLALARGQASAAPDEPSEASASTPSLRERLRSERAATPEPAPEDRLPPREPESATLGTRGRGAGKAVGVTRAPIRNLQIQRFPGDLHRRITIGAATRNMAVRDFVIEALRWAMEREWAPLRAGELVEGALASSEAAQEDERES